MPMSQVYGTWNDTHTHAALLGWQTAVNNCNWQTNLSLWLSFCLLLLLLVKAPLNSTAGTARPAAHHAWTIW